MLAKPLNFTATTKFPRCERKLWRRVCEWSGAHGLSVMGPSFPCLPSQKHGHPYLHGQGWQLLESTAAAKLSSLPLPDAAGPGGRLDTLASSSPLRSAAAPPGKLNGSPGRSALVKEGQTDPGVCSEACWESPGAGGSGQHRRFRRCSSERTAPGVCGA